jgi:hypothetical protein
VATIPCRWTILRFYKYGKGEEGKGKKERKEMEKKEERR